MNVVGLYAATCRCVLRARPEDPESWADLSTLLPILRQALACCVCAGILNVPMAPIETICQHHVCQTCIGGRMRVKPTCSWCKEWDDFVEKPQVRCLVQCFKGLCKYLASSSLANDLAQTNNGGKNTLMTLVQEGADVPDVYSPPEPDLKLGFVPVLPLATVSSVTQPLVVDCGSSHQSPKRPTQEKNAFNKEVKESCVHSSGKVIESNHHEAPKNHKSNDSNVDTHKHSPKRNTRMRDHDVAPKNVLNKDNKQDKHHKKDAQSKDPKTEKFKKGDKEKSCAKEGSKIDKEDSIQTPSRSENEKPVKHSTRTDRNIFQTVAAEHDYNAAWSTPESPRTRARRTSGYKSDDSTGPRSPAAKRHRLGSGADGVHIPASLEEASPQPHPPLTRVLPPQSQTPSTVTKQVTDQDPKLNLNVKPRKRVNKKPKPNGCRCGLATPNPGKLTCCGQRCPCYSAFKGCCPDCRCRGCRNPRKLVPDVPAPAPPPELFPPESTLTLTDVHSESEESEIEIDI